MIYLLTFNCQTSKIITLSELKDKLTSSTSKSYRRQKFDYTKIASCLFCQLNSNQLQRWFSFSYTMFALFTIIKNYIHKKWLLSICTTYLYVCSMLSQLKHNGFFLFFRWQKSSYFPTKKHVAQLRSLLKPDSFVYDNIKFQVYSIPSAYVHMIWGN